MRLDERALPVRMRRVVVVALADRSRELLVAVAETGTIELSGPLSSGEGPALEALRRLEGRTGRRSPTAPALLREPPDIARLERDGLREPLAGEVELARRSAAGLRHDGFVMFVGWVPEPAMAALTTRVESLGASVVELEPPRGHSPPTLLAPAPAADPFRPLVATYGAVPYEDLDPTPFVAITYCLMFGMMFGDVGDGLVLVLAALALRRTRRARLQGVRRVWRMIAAAGAASVGFGLLYGELFGPTKVLPALWLAPLDSPVRLLTLGIAVGACLLAAGYLMGIVNRWREGGPALALTAGSGVPGLMLLVGAGLIVAGIARHVPRLEQAGLGVGALAMLALLVGLVAEVGRRGAAVLEVLIRLLDSVLRLLSNVISFARLAAFGLMHAAIGLVVLHAAGSLTGTPAGDAAAALVFTAGWAVAFALEGLVVAVQALRLEYYELFSHMFTRDGRAFRPFTLPLFAPEEAR